MRKVRKRKGKVTAKAFQQAKDLLNQGVKTSLVAEVVGLHFTTINIIRKCDALNDYRAFNKRKTAKRMTKKDTPKIHQLPTPDIPVVSTNSSTELFTKPLGADMVRDHITGEVNVGGSTFWTYEHASGVFNVSYSAISRLVNDSDTGIVAKTIGRRKFISVSSLRDYLSRPDMKTGDAPF
jgi:hypothetical protein